MFAHADVAVPSGAPAVALVGAEPIAAPASPPGTALVIADDVDDDAADDAQHAQARAAEAEMYVEAELAKIRSEAAISAARTQVEADMRAADQEAAAMISLQKQSEAELAAEILETSRIFAAYMEDNDIEFDGGSWNVDDRSTNRPILLEIAKIMQEHDHVMLKIHGVQKGETKPKGLMMYGEAYPGEPVPESGAITAQGRVLACKAVLVAGAG